MPHRYAASAFIGVEQWTIVNPQCHVGEMAIETKRFSGTSRRWNAQVL